MIQYPLQVWAEPLHDQEAVMLAPRDVGPASYVPVVKQVVTY
jgi:hypothetical protein